MTRRNPSDRDDHRIDMVLHALGNAGPDEGLQVRLVEALYAAPNTPRTAHPRWWRHVAQPVSYGARFAVAACLLVAVSASVYQAALNRSSKSARQTVPVDTSREWALDHRTAATALAHTAGAPLQPPAQASLAASRTTATPVVTARLPRSASAPEGSNARPHQVEPATFPPPPLPLTEQERLLLRLSRQQPGAQLAMLTRPAQDARFERNRAAVSEFFAPAPPLRSQEDSASPEPPVDLPTEQP